MGRRQGCSRLGVRRFDEPYRDWSVPLFVTLRKVENVLNQII